jgi:hypothetical protein
MASSVDKLAGGGEDENFSMTTAKEGGAAEEKFMGQKERRKSSAVKMFLGDYLSLATNQSILKVLTKNGTLNYLVYANRRYKYCVF